MGHSAFAVHGRITSIPSNNRVYRYHLNFEQQWWTLIVCYSHEAARIVSVDLDCEISAFPNFGRNDRVGRMSSDIELGATVDRNHLPSMPIVQRFRCSIFGSVRNSAMTRQTKNLGLCIFFKAILLTSRVIWLRFLRNDVILHQTPSRSLTKVTWKMPPIKRR